MKKILYSLLIFVSVFFFLDKVSALGFGSSLTNKEELGTFYVNNGNYWISLYGNNGTGSTCDNTLTAPIECWKNGTISYVLGDTTYENYKINSLRLSLKEPMQTNHYYHVTINYTLNSTSYSYIKNWFEITAYNVFDYSNTCSDIYCKLDFIMQTTATKPTDLDDLWIDFTTTAETYTFKSFNTGVSHLYAPIVEEVKYTPPPIPSGEDVVYFDTKSSNFIATYNTLKVKLKEILDTLKNNNPNNYKWAVYIGEDSSGSFISVNLLPSNFSSNPTDSNYAYCYVNTSKYSNVYYNAGGCNTNNVATKRYTFRSSSSISTLKSDLSLSFSSISGITAGSNIIQHSYLNQFNFTNNEYDYFTTNNYFILPYSANVPIYNYNRSSSSTFYHIKIGDSELSFNSKSYLESSDEFIDVKDYYEFNETIDDIDLAKMIFDFDVSVFKERGNIFDYLIQFETIGSIQEDDSLNTNHLQKFSRPYIEYVDRNGLVRRYEVDFGYEDQENPRTFWWTGNQDEIIGDITSLKLIIPMHETAYARYLIQLTSYIPFTVSYVTNQEHMIYYETIDLSNKYGVVFMPKLVENDSDISSVFYTDAIEEILVYSSYDYKKQPIEIYDKNIDEFSYIITYEQQDYNLFFKVNPQVSNLAIVTYDTRYYTYKIVDSKYSLGTLVNPNTNENHYVDFSNTANLKADFDSLSSIFTFISQQMDKQSAAYVLFYDSVSAFFNTMPTDIYIMILTTLAIILLGVSLALGGWK